MTRTLQLSVVVLCCVLTAPPVLAVPPSDPATSVSLHIDPAEVPVTMLYNGTTVRVDATVPSQHDVAFVCAGKEGEVRLKQKGKVWGFLWMNVGEASLEHVPGYYNVVSTRPLESLASPTALADLGVGFGAVESRVAPDPGDEATRKLLGELIKLKQREGLFGVSATGIHVEPLDGGLERVSTEFRLPAKAPFGPYEVSLVGFDGDSGTRLATGAFTVRTVGLAAFISDLSRQHGLLFGILAVMVAIVVGLLTGVVFGLGSKKAH